MVIHKMLTEVKINGVDVTSKILKWQVNQNYGYEINDCIIHLSKKVDTLVTLASGQSITIKRGTGTATDQFVFKGEIVTLEEKGYSYKITGLDALYDAVKKEITYSFDKNTDSEAGQISELFKTLINDYTDLTANDTSVQATGILDEEKIGKFVCRHEDVFSKLQLLASFANYQMYYDPTTDLVYFEPKGWSKYSTSLTVGNQISNLPKWVTDNSQLCNSVIIFGATQDIETTESGQLDVTGGWESGDGNGCTLSFKPISVKVYADASNPPRTLRKGGVVGATADYDYSVDFETKKLVWETGNGYAWSPNHYVEVRYTHSIPVPIAGSDDTSIFLYTEHKKTFSPKQIITIEDAEFEGNRILQKFSTPFKSSELFVVGVYDLSVGDVVQVIDTNNSISAGFIITSLTLKYPHKYDIVGVGDKELKFAEYAADIARKIKELEQLLVGDTDFLIHLIRLFHDIVYQRKSIYCYDRDITDAFVLNHPVYGVLDTSELGPTAHSWVEYYSEDY